MGRWTHITISLKGVKITFVSAYRVCKQTTDLDKNTAYMQQWRVLAENQTRPDPRKQSLLDLKQFLSKEIKKEENWSSGSTRTKE